MMRAIELAKLGTGFTNPNPLVGAVIVKNGKIIGEGWHEKYGSLHAERNALNNCVESPDGADMYVTLEPCCHHGKQPPCTDAVISSGIKNIYVGSYDPNPLVAAKSLDLLRRYGITVTDRVLKDKCDDLNRIFFHYITTGTPYVIMKTAVTMDGRIATRTGNSKWITNELSRQNVHNTRKRVAAVMVGINTVLADDPMLNCRTEQPSNGVRIVCDSNLRIPMDCNLVKTAREIPVIVACSCNNKDKIKNLNAAGVDVIVTDGTRVDLTMLMNELGKRKIDSVLVEGGAELNASLLKLGLVNKFQLYIAPKLIGGIGARPCVGGEGADLIKDAYKFKNPHVTKFGDDILIEYDVAPKEGN